MKRSHSIVYLGIGCLGALAFTQSTSVSPGLINPRECWDVMIKADTPPDGNGDFCLNEEEFFSFTKDYDPWNTYQNVLTVSDAPQAWKTAWADLITVCTQDVNLRTCGAENVDAEGNGCIPVRTERPPVEISNPTELHVFYVCYITRETLLFSLNSAAPTHAPTVSSPPSTNPSSSPSDEPTASPSQSPTVSTAPSLAPSTSPSSVPSSVPSSSPSAQPTTSPSQSPTVSLKPSLAPSTSPSSVPSSVPSSQPSLSPIILKETANVRFAFVSQSETFLQDVQNLSVSLTDWYSDTSAGMATLWQQNVHGEEDFRRLRALKQNALACILENATTTRKCPFCMPGTLSSEISLLGV